MEMERNFLPDLKIKDNIWIIHPGLKNDLGCQIDNIFID